jgi:hypothetical protein
MKLTLASLFFCLLASGNAIAHADRILAIGPGGTLADVPAKYGPASLIIKFSAPMTAAPAITSMALRLGEARTEVPACITSLLRSKRMEEVVATGSWYHDESLLPYYLNLTFFDPGYSVKRWANPGVKLLFNLRSGKLIRVESLEVGDNGRSLQHVAVDLGSRCSPDIIAGLSSSPVP